MDVEKRKREEDDGGVNGKRAKAEEEDNAAVRAVVPTPRDDEVEEFYAILKRIQVAVKYFEDRNGGRRSADHRRDLTAKTWSPSFVPEDFEDGRKVDADPAEENQKAGLDLNSDPVPDAV